MDSFEMTDSNSSSHDVDGQGEGLVGHGGDFRLSHALAQIAALERPATLIAYSVLRAHDLVDDALQDSKFAVIRRLESNATTPRSVIPPSRMTFSAMSRRRGSAAFVRITCARCVTARSTFAIACIASRKS